MKSTAHAVRGFAALLLIAFQMSLCLPAASAHATLVEATPRAGESLPAAPPRVVLRFDEPLLDGANQLTVTGPGGATWATGAPAVSGAQLSADLPGLGPSGEYTVTYRVTSADGHAVTGSTYFTLTVGGGADAAAAPASEAGGGVPVLPILAIGALVALAGAAVFAVRRR